MGTKTISIMNDAYKMLVSKKGKDESFSDVIRRITKKRRDIMEVAGSWSHISDEDIEEMKKNIEIIGEHATKDLMRNTKNDMRRF